MESHSIRRLFLCASAALALFTGCGGSVPGISNPQNSAYYWKTVYSSDSLEQAFVSEFGIKKLYIRYFDVILTQDGRPMPNATIRFKDLPDSSLKIIPTVFISEGCLHHNIDTLAGLLVDRVMQISETHGVRNVGEIQIDCDWTRRSQDLYFNFLQKVRGLCRDKGLLLSATIRLHQLSMDPPPCDYGALMLYNTGSARDPRVENPILGYDQVEPFLRHMAGYRLPLCAALPNFKWQLLSGRGQFKGILYGLQLGDSAMFASIGDGKYIAVRSKDVPRYMGDDSYNVMISMGDTIKQRKAEFCEIEKVCAAIMQRRPDILSQVIIYDLNNSNINNISKNEYEKIFNFGNIAHSR